MVLGEVWSDMGRWLVLGVGSSKHKASVDTAFPVFVPVLFRSSSAQRKVFMGRGFTGKAKETLEIPSISWHAVWCYM